MDSIKSALLTICAVNAVVGAFLLWLIYDRRAPAESASRLSFLPSLSVLLKGYVVNKMSQTNVKIWNALL